MAPAGAYQAAAPDPAGARVVACRGPRAEERGCEWRASTLCASRRAVCARTGAAVAATSQGVAFPGGQPRRWAPAAALSNRHAVCPVSRQATCAALPRRCFRAGVAGHAGAEKEKRALRRTGSHNALAAA